MLFPVALGIRVASSSVVLVFANYVNYQDLYKIPGYFFEAGFYLGMFNQDAQYC